jgi:hypothetical protein
MSDNEVSNEFINRMFARLLVDQLIADFDAFSQVMETMNLSDVCTVENGRKLNALISAYYWTKLSLELDDD